MGTILTHNQRKKQELQALDVLTFKDELNLA